MICRGFLRLVLAVAAAWLMAPAGALAQTDADAEPQGAETTAGVMMESRGVWIGREEMLEGREKLAARLDRLSSAGINTVYVNTQFRGYVAYPGGVVMPQFPDFAKGDSGLLDFLVPAIQERGMRAEAWTEYGFFAYYTPDREKDASRGVILDRHPELTAIAEDGAPFMKNETLGYFYSMCPANPASHEILAGIYLEMINRYPFDGLNLDRVRFFDKRFCHCDYCRTAFREASGMVLPKFDEATTAAAAWKEWRKRRTGEFVRGLALAMRAKYPGRSLTSAVVSPDVIEDKGQDWPSWMRAGLLDAAMPMLYARDISGSVAFIKANVPEGAPIYYGIDAGLGWNLFSAQIDSLRKERAQGITIWYGVPLDPLLGNLGAGPFAARAVSPLGGPGKGR